MSIVNQLKNIGIESLYHFTDYSNIASIEHHGILSLKQIKEKNIKVARFGADSLSHSLDRFYKLDHFVHLSFIDDHPMYHKAKQRGTIVKPVWLEIDVSILEDFTTLASNTIANKTGANIFFIDDIFKYIDFKKFYSLNFATKVEARKAEVMVPNAIPINKIKGAFYGK